MVESAGKLQPFTTIKYTTKDGETISATKNNGIVTLVGDKNGVRQMELEDFKKELIATLPNVALEKTPSKDTVEISKDTQKSPQAAAPKEITAAKAPVQEQSGTKQLDKIA